MTTQLAPAESLTGQDRAMLSAIARYWSEHEIPPTIRDLQEALGISSLSVTDYRLKRLEQRGLIRRTPRITRSIRIVGPIERWEAA